MNAMLPLFAATAATGADRAPNLLAAARALTVHLSRSRPLDRRIVAGVMTTTFGGSDTEGAWLWRDAYDAIEAAMVLQLRRLNPQLERMEDAPSEIAALLANLSGLGLTHSRRSDEQVALDQFSTPPELGALAVLAGQVRPGDHVLEPSAGHGLMAVLAEACGAELTLNERAADRAAVLDGLFPGAARHRLDALHLRDALPASGSFHVALDNPPFQRLDAHLAAALGCLAEGGRLSAIVPARLLEDRVALAGIAAYGRIVARLPFYANAFAKHGTAVDTGLLVIDRGVDAGAVVVRTDAVTGAETRLTRFQVRTRRDLLTAGGALAGVDRDAVVFAVNAKSGRAALVVQGLTTTNDDDRLIPLCAWCGRRNAASRHARAMTSRPGRTSARPPGAPPGRPSWPRPIRGSRARWCWSPASCCRSGRASPTKARPCGASRLRMDGAGSDVCSTQRRFHA